ncbi:conserved hypothetical protein [Magnetococcus marinus MC-1]|uniref:Uncharacterized protein n=1 Tax=Magnetococcus marinus (strain ATCC BAA-1437 / JCM 17883 / MC-1) TaxID=156889 RepID=A0L996_MAGMM|nr:hypothetical protein [Magnetococcus marinus]ABK44539.1 conserved hypothetical protein [Magnetococcus marinus MC-1]
MGKKTHTLIGGGECFIGPFGGGAGMRFLGEASKVELSFSEEKKTLKNYSTPGGGTADTVSLITDVQLVITAHGFDTESLAMATFGESGSIAGGTVTDESHVAYRGGYLRAKEGVDLSAVSLTNSGTPLVEGTDYEVKGGGVRILEAAENVVDGDTVLMTYTHASSATVEAILNAGKEYRLSFDGFNQAFDGKPVVLDVYRVKNTPSSLGLVTDDFGNIEFSMDVLKDDSKTGAGVSKFFKLMQIEG